MATKQIKIDDKLFDINYEIINPKCKNNIIFLHGWGSNKELMKQAFKPYLTNLKHIYIDMPGFGKSNNKYILNTYDYQQIINIFLINISIHLDNNTIIVGHSFGGKVATLLNPKKLVLLSSAGIVEEKSAKTLLTIKMAKIFNRFGLKKVTKLLRSNDVNMMNENMYETFKNVVDEDFSKSFSNYKNKALIFWGEKDTATTLRAGQTIHSLIKQSEFITFSSDHYFFLQYANNISNKIDNIFNQY